MKFCSLQQQLRVLLVVAFSAAYRVAGLSCRVLSDMVVQLIVRYIIVLANIFIKACSNI